MIQRIIETAENTRGVPALRWMGPEAGLATLFDAHNSSYWQDVDRNRLSPKHLVGSLT